MNECLTLKDIVDQLGGEIIEQTNDVRINRVGSLAYAQADAISFLNDTKYSDQLSQTKAAAIILKPEHRGLATIPAIVTDNPYAYFAKVSQLLNPKYKELAGVHQSAVIDASVNVPATCSIGANVTIGSDVVLGDDVVVGAGSVIERNVSIGRETVLEANVTIKHGSQIGEHCHIFSGAVIGNDGFGYAEEHGDNDSQYWVKIPQIGRVIIEDHVDIGANTTIDRGAIDDTFISKGVKVDNQVQIAHNCRIGAHTVVAGCVGIAGSAVIGAHCKLGGSAMILGHLNIVDNVTVSPGSMIMRSIVKAGTYTALMPSQQHDDWLKTAANIRHLTQLADKIKAVETTIKRIENDRK